MTKAKEVTIAVAYEMGAKVKHRTSQESAVVNAICVNQAGNWYDMATPGGMSLGWWHESDIDGAPPTRPPSTRRKRQD